MISSSIVFLSEIIVLLHRFLHVPNTGHALGENYEVARAEGHGLPPVRGLDLNLPAHREIFLSFHFLLPLFPVQWLLPIPV